VITGNRYVDLNHRAIVLAKYGYHLVVGGITRVPCTNLRAMPVRSATHRINLNVIDAMAALALTAGALVDLVSQNSRELGPLAVVFSVLATGSVAWRRRSPVQAVLVAVTALLALTFTESVAADRQLLFEPVAMAFDYYMLGRLLDIEKRRRALIGCALFGFSGLLIDSLYPGGWSTASFVAGTLIFFGIPLVIGQFIRRRKLLIDTLEQTMQSLEIERELIAAEAAGEERGRIARELHDAIAHNLIVMVIQSSGARRKLMSDPSAAHDALNVVIHSGREAMEELRRIMGVAHRSDDGLDVAAPGLSQVDNLLLRTRAAGIPAQLRIEGDPCTLSPGLDLAAYRVIQEAITNVIKHAGPASVLIRLRFQAGWLELEITDSGVGPGNGNLSCSESRHGLIGMRERIALFGGELWTGPAEGGGFVVRARMPVAS
jgi:signal transduction histidine kinase